jgi:RNase H-fold protein (predicted Holliday junction resolvase)
MEPQKMNKDVMTSDFSTIKTDANLKEAFEGIKKMLEKSPHSPGLIVIGTPQESRSRGEVVAGERSQDGETGQRD